MSKPPNRNRKDIKKAIKAFIHHVETLENAENSEINGFDAEYKLIQEAQIRNKREKIFSMDVGKAENNLKKNRYKDILPYDDHRVILSAIEGDQDSNYINASKLMGVRGTGGYIATQGPLATTVNDFWRMIWEYNVEIVFMACRIVELGKIKCKQYWNDLGKTEEYVNITVFTETEKKIMSDCVQRNFLVTKGEEVRHVIQYHYSGWPDHGIPDDAGHIRDMIGLIRQARHNDQAPLLVHCSAGCGRTGAIIAIDYVWTLLEEGKQFKLLHFVDIWIYFLNIINSGVGDMHEAQFDDAFSLFALICNFREQRMSIVQTAGSSTKCRQLHHWRDQYALVNKVLKSLCEEWLTRMASHTYENVKLDEVSDIVGNTPDLTSKPASQDYQNRYTANSHFQKEDSAQSPDKSPFIEKWHVDELKGQTLEATQPKEGINSRSAYGNVPHAKEGSQEDMVSQKHLPTNPASSECAVHRTIVQADFGSPTNQAQTSDLGESTESPYAEPWGQTPAFSFIPHILQPAFNGSQAKVYPSLSPKPHLADTFIYSTVNKKGSQFSSDNAAACNLVNKKVSKAPSPPVPSQQQQSSINGAIYSGVNKPPALKSPGAVPLPSSKPPNLSDSDYTSVYSMASDIGSEPVFTPYEVINFPGSPNNRIVSSGAQKVSGGKHSSASSIIQSLGQINSGNLPGFGERLPRVRGPVPMPQAWNKI